MPVHVTFSFSIAKSGYLRRCLALALDRNALLTALMPKKRKNRTHLKGAATDAKSKEGIPKSFIIKHGHVGSSITQLVRDLRKVMEPNTASRLRVSKCYT